MRTLQCSVSSRIASPFDFRVFPFHVLSVLFSGFFVVAPSSSFAFEMFLNENLSLWCEYPSTPQAINFFFNFKFEIQKQNKKCYEAFAPMLHCAPLILRKWSYFPAFCQFRMIAVCGAKPSHQCCTVHAPLLFGKWRSFPAFRQFRIASASSGSF